MSSRESILQKIAANKPELVPLPAIDLEQVMEYDDLVMQFKNTLRAIGAAVIELPDIAVLNAQIREEQQVDHYIINTLTDTAANAELAVSTAAALETLHKVYLKGTVGVAENGCIWLYEHQMKNRLLPYICQHLALVVERERIVPTMHHAYQQIDIDREGFGGFIAGPSKTADIEQSLVIGAHGARSLEVYIV